MTPVYRTGDVVAERYRVTRFVGAGRVGEVFEVEDLELREAIALKRVHAELARDEAWQECLRRALSRARTIAHPNVCRIFDVGFDGEVPFWTMQRAAGESLARSRRASLTLVTQIASALDAAHDAGLAHGGFSARSVFVVDGERALITDLGLSFEVLGAAADFDAARAADIRALQAMGGRPAAGGAPRRAGDVARSLLAARRLRLAAAIALATVASIALVVVTARARPAAGLVLVEGCGWRGLARVELFTDRDAFVRAIGSQRVVDFDDIDASGPAPVRLAADRYRDHGIVLDRPGGLFAHHDFGQPTPPVATGNVCAAGPPPSPGQRATPAPRTTDVDFQVEGRAACTAGFGLTFIGLEYAGAGQPALTIYDGAGATLGSVSEFTSAEPSVFRGFVVRDRDGHLLPVLARARIGSGNQWPGTHAGGMSVFLDDLTFVPPR